MSRFAQVQAVTAKWEGGWSDHPADPGGKTMYGLTDRVWQAYLREKGEPPSPVRSATKEQVEDLFKSQYWDAVGGDSLPPGIDLAVYDFAIQSGQTRAVRHLQAALGIKQDGMVGHVTRAAAQEAYERDSDGDVIRRIMASRRAFIADINKPGWQKSFRRGVDRRLDDVAARAARMEEVEDKALKWSKSIARDESDRAKPPVVYRPEKAAPPLPDPVTPVQVPDGLGKVSAGAGVISTILAAVTSPWALGAVVVLVAAGGVAYWLHKTGRLTLNKPTEA